MSNTLISNNHPCTLPTVLTVTMPPALATPETIETAAPVHRDMALRYLSNVINKLIVPAVTDSTTHAALNTERERRHGCAPIDIETTDTAWRRFAQECRELNTHNTAEVLLIRQRFLRLAQRYGVALHTLHLNPAP